jgi:hypothetical protein
MRVIHRELDVTALACCDRCGRPAPLRPVPEAIWIDEPVAKGSLTALFDNACGFCKHSWRVQSPCIAFTPANNVVWYPLTSFLDIGTQRERFDDLVLRHSAQQFEKIIVGDLATLEAILQYPSAQAVTFGHAEHQYLERAHLSHPERVEFLLTLHRDGALPHKGQLNVALGTEEATEAFVGAIEARLARGDLNAGEEALLAALSRMVAKAATVQGTGRPAGLAGVVTAERFQATVGVFVDQVVASGTDESAESWFERHSRVELPELRPEAEPRSLTALPVSRSDLVALVDRGFALLNAGDEAQLMHVGQLLLHALRVPSDVTTAVGFTKCLELGYGLMFVGYAAIRRQDLVLAERDLRLAISVLSDWPGEDTDHRMAIERAIARCYSSLGAALRVVKPGHAVDLLLEGANRWAVVGDRTAHADALTAAAETVVMLNDDDRSVPLLQRLATLVDEGLVRDEATLARIHTLLGGHSIGWELAEHADTGVTLTVRYFTKLEGRGMAVYRQEQFTRRKDIADDEVPRDQATPPPMALVIAMEFLGTRSEIALGLLDSPGMGHLWLGLAHARRSGLDRMRVGAARCVAQALLDSGAPEFAAWVLRGERGALDAVVAQDEDVATSYVLTGLEAVLLKDGVERPKAALELLADLYAYAASKRHGNPQMLTSPLFAVACQEFARKEEWDRFLTMAAWVMGTGDEQRASAGDDAPGRKVQSIYLPIFSRIVAAYAESKRTDPGVEFALCSYALSARYRGSGGDHRIAPPTLEDVVQSLPASAAMVVYIPFEVPASGQSARRMAVALVTAEGLLAFAMIDVARFLQCLDEFDDLVEQITAPAGSRPQPPDLGVLRALADVAIPAPIMQPLLDRGIESVAFATMAETTRLPLLAMLEHHPLTAGRRPARVSAVLRPTAPALGAEPAHRLPRVFYVGATDLTGLPAGLPSLSDGRAHLVAFDALEVTLPRLVSWAGTVGNADILIYVGHAEYVSGPAGCSIRLGGDAVGMLRFLDELMPILNPQGVVLGACGIGVIDTWMSWSSREAAGPVERALANGATTVLAPLWPQFAHPLLRILDGTVDRLLHQAPFGDALREAVYASRSGEPGGTTAYGWIEWAGVGLFGDSGWRAPAQ